MSDRTPLELLQDEAIKLVRAGGLGVYRENLDEILVRAFDAGSAARKALDEETAEIEQRETAGYIVSESSSRIVPTKEDGETPTHYPTAQDAGDAILRGFHGQIGTRYVLKVVTSVEAEYSRGWALVREND